MLRLNRYSSSQKVMVRSQQEAGSEYIRRELDGSGKSSYLRGESGETILHELLAAWGRLVTVKPKIDFSSIGWTAR